ncbi:MAG: hypothetical protein ABII74_06830 [Elusimicrobiota bacterium]
MSNVKVSFCKKGDFYLKKKIISLSRREKMKERFFASAVVLLAVINFPARSYAGSLNPSGPPSATGYTLSDIAARISSGTAASGHSLYPTAGPAPTGVTLTQIYNALPGGAMTSASAGDVIAGKTFITRANGSLTFSTGTFTARELPDTGQTTVYVPFDDARPGFSQRGV